MLADDSAINTFWGFCQTLIRSSLMFDPDQLFPLLSDALGWRVHLRTLKSLARLKIYSQRVVEAIFVWTQWKFTYCNRSTWTHALSYTDFNEAAPRKKYLII